MENAKRHIPVIELPEYTPIERYCVQKDLDAMAKAKCGGASAYIVFNAKGDSSVHRFAVRYSKARGARPAVASKVYIADGFTLTKHGLSFLESKTVADLAECVVEEV